MKFIFSLLILVSMSHALAAPIVIYYELPNGQEYANHMKKYLEEKHQIPALLIKTQKQRRIVKM